MKTVDSPSPPRTAPSLGLAAVIVSAIVLGSGSTIVKYSGAPGVVIAFWRSWFLAALWWSIVVIRKVSISRAGARRGLLVGLVFGANMCIFFSSVRFTRVANVEFVSAFSPILLVAIGFLMLRERVPGVVLVAGAIALAGSLEVLWFAQTKDDRNSWFGNLLAVFTALTWVAYLVTARRARNHLSTIELMACIMTGAAVVTSVLVVVFDATGVLAHGPLTQMTPKAWGVVAISTVLNGLVAHTLLTWSQTKVAMSTIGLIQISQPVLATLFAWLILDESIRPQQVVGMVAVTFSMAVVAVFASRIAPGSDRAR